MTHFPLPTNTSFAEPSGFFTYMNSVSPILMPTFLIVLYVGYLMIQVQNNEDLVNASFSASFVTMVIAVLLWLMGALDGFVVLTVGLLVGVSGGLLYWTQKD